MGRGQRDDIESKSKLVTEICSIATLSIACIHGCCGSKSPFIDWYLLLRVGEDAETDVIRKQYRKLALQLHPDKNSHPKAEVAFKLVSEVSFWLMLVSLTKRKDESSTHKDGIIPVQNAKEFQVRAVEVTPPWS
ncbi:hypothetical protein Sjap_006897 [Stephania japonica]|uniref:J domain-containing protein n=1 Tax=Stephania japonica TaxID=461633 RepID=A0AAP0PLI3_9MAGN